MGYWDFLNVLTTLKERNQRKTGKPIVKEGLPESNKDMIRRLKDKHGRN